MKKIRVQFIEATHYEVEFEVEDDVSVDEENWFGLMDVAKPKWPTQSKIMVMERELGELEVPNELGVSK